MPDPFPSESWLTSLELGDTVGARFILKHRAGAGGMGAVFRAIDQLDGSNVALKLMQGSAPTEIERFTREAGLLAELRHDAIVRYVAHGATPDGTRYVAM